LDKFRKLLRTRINFLENKAQKISLQISNSKDTLENYSANLTKDADQQANEHFITHEIPQEHIRLDYLETKVHESLQQVEILRVILNGSALL
jgi:predicted RNase H-like nuclease (RuvC/YqgF family)